MLKMSYFDPQAGGEGERGRGEGGPKLFSKIWLRHLSSLIGVYLHAKLQKKLMSHYLHAKLQKKLMSHSRDSFGTNGQRN